MPPATGLREFHELAEQVLRVDAGKLQLARSHPDRGRKAGEFAVRHVRRRRDDDAALGQVAADFRELVPQALTALGSKKYTSPAAIFPSCCASKPRSIRNVRPGLVATEATHETDRDAAVDAKQLLQRGAID